MHVSKILCIFAPSNRKRIISDPSRTGGERAQSFKKGGGDKELGGEIGGHHQGVERAVANETLLCNEQIREEEAGNTCDEKKTGVENGEKETWGVREGVEMGGGRDGGGTGSRRDGGGTGGGSNAVRA